MLRNVVLSAVTLAALAATAQAQPGPDAPQGPPPAPMTDDWKDVSHINGTLVKVGERDDYLVKNPKHFNLSTNPIGYLFGFYGFSVQGAVSDNVTLRGNVEFFDYEFFGRTTGHELAVSAPIYFRRAFSGPFIEPGVLYQQTMDTPWDLWDDGGDAPTPVAHTFLGPEILFGWHWTFDSGLNVAMAFGAARNLSTKMSTDGYESSDPLPTGYLRFGYAF